MKIPIKPVKFNLRIALVAAFLLVVLYVAYLGYSSLYSNIFSEPEQLPEGSVVRVNLKAYESTMEYLDGLYNYTPEPLRLPRNNPFQ